MDEQWIQEMRQKMADYQWPAPEVSWDELDLALAAGVTHQTNLLWLRRMAAAAVILLIAGVGYWGLLRDETDLMHPTASEFEVNLGSQGDRNACDVSDVTSFLSPSDLKKTKLEHHSTAMSEPEVIPISMGDKDTINTTEVTEKEQPHPVEEKERPTKEILPVIYPSELHQRQHIDNRLTAKVYMSSAMTGSQTEFYGMGAYLGSSSELSGHPNFANLAAHTEQRVHHRQPVRFGLSLRYRLTDRWSVESGLSYTRLSSDITTIIDDKTTVTEQRLNYIGLPLNISYELWRSRYFGLYVSGGSTIEKQLEASPWQFSLNGAAGAEYKLTDFFSLYAEPGIGYYFKDGSSTPTIYNDHPLNFNLSFGLRLHLK